MSWRERIRAAREEQKLTREQVINKMRLYMKDGKGIAVRTLIAWESGESEPRVTQAIALARALGYNEVSRLFAEPDTPQLNKAGLDMLESYRNLLMLAPQYRENPHPVLRVLPVYLQPASAGTGQWLDDDMADQIEVDDSVPASAQFGVRLAGDSMTPRFADGQIVWAKSVETADNGTIVLCYLNGQGYCKKLRRDGHGVALMSLNPAYQPIAVGAEDEFRIMGVVVG